MKLVYGQARGCVEGSEGLDMEERRWNSNIKEKQQACYEVNLAPATKQVPPFLNFSPIELAAVGKSVATKGGTGIARGTTPHAENEVEVASQAHFGLEV